MSADGRRLAVATINGRRFDGAGVALSADGGKTWRDATNPSFVSVLSSSSSGERLVGASPWHGVVATSRDGGDSFTAVDGASPDKVWMAVASSGDGQRLLAAATRAGDKAGGVWRSANAGATWQPCAGAAAAAVRQQFQQSANDSLTSWRALAVSADGQCVLALQDGNLGAAASRDAGATWRALPSLAIVSNPLWTSAASSADGRTLYAAGANGTVHVSRDGGDSFAPTAAPSAWGTALATSASGRIVVAACQTFDRVTTPGGLFVSTDAGRTWARAADTDDAALNRAAGGEREVNRGWKSVAVSGDGKRVAAAASLAGVWVGMV